MPRISAVFTRLPGGFTVSYSYESELTSDRVNHQYRSRFGHGNSSDFFSTIDNELIDDIERVNEDSEVFEDLPVNPIEGSRTPQNEDPDVLREENLEDLEVSEIFQFGQVPHIPTEVPAIRRSRTIPAAYQDDSFDILERTDEPFEPYVDDERRLSLDRIKRFFTFYADKKSVNDGCAVCIDGVEINKLMIRMDCDHFCCSECISKWFEKNTSCPVCRKDYYN